MSQSRSKPLAYKYDQAKILESLHPVIVLTRLATDQIIAGFPEQALSSIRMALMPLHAAHEELQKAFPPKRQKTDYPAPG